MQALFGAFTKQHLIPNQPVHPHIDAHMAPHTMPTYSQFINSYVDSQRTSPQPPLVIEPHLAMSPRAAHYNHPEWVAMLQHYHRELDKLREDWALEVLGRPMFEMMHYRHLNNSTKGYLWPSHMIQKPWPRRLQFWSRLQLDGIWRYWRFHVKEGLYPLRWGPLQSHYMQRKDKIERKYCSQLGLLRPKKQDRDYYFPSRSFEVLHRWVPFYLGQDNLRVKVERTCMPPAYEWTICTTMTGRDGKYLYRMRWNDCASFAKNSVSYWERFGFYV